MKVLMLNGSPHENGNTRRALAEMEKIFAAEGVETQVVHVGGKNIAGCSACGGCSKLRRCVIDDGVNEICELFREADGLVAATPVHYAGAVPALAACLDRMFYSIGFDPTMKVGAAVCVARRGGITAAFDQLNHYFGINGMPVAGGQYWNGVHGNGGAADAEQDGEGMQQMRTLARNMVFLMRAIAREKAENGLPEKEAPVVTNFIR